MAQPIKNRECAECGGSIPDGAGSRAVVCSAECRRVRKHRAQAEYRERKRTGEFRKCEDCGADLSRKSGPNRFCADCAPKTGGERTRRWIAENRETHNAARAEWRRTDKGRQAVARWGAARRAKKAGVEHVPWDREAILARDGHRCYLCGGLIPDGGVQIDHVRPLALGGADAPWNVAATHGMCNMTKSDRFDEVSQEMERRLLAEVKHVELETSPR